MKPSCRIGSLALVLGIVVSGQVFEIPGPVKLAAKAGQFTIARIQIDQRNYVCAFRFRFTNDTSFTITKTIVRAEIVMADGTLAKEMTILHNIAPRAVADAVQPCSFAEGTPAKVSLWTTDTTTGPTETEISAAESKRQADEAETAARVAKVEAAQAAADLRQQREAKAVRMQIYNACQSLKTRYANTPIGAIPLKAADQIAQCRELGAW